MVFIRKYFSFASPRVSKSKILFGHFSLLCSINISFRFKVWVIFYHKYSHTKFWIKSFRNMHMYNMQNWCRCRLSRMCCVVTGVFWFSKYIIMHCYIFYIFVVHGTKHSTETVNFRFRNQFVYEQNMHRWKIKQPYEIFAHELFLVLNTISEWMKF